MHTHTTQPTSHFAVTNTETNLYHTLVSCYEESPIRDKRYLLDNVMPNVAQIMGIGSVSDMLSMAASQIIQKAKYLAFVPLIFGILAFCVAYFVQPVVLQIFWLMTSAFITVTGTLALILARINTTRRKQKMTRSSYSTQVTH